MHSPVAHQKMVAEADPVLAANFRDAGVWDSAMAYGFVEAEIGFVEMEEAENR